MASITLNLSGDRELISKLEAIDTRITIIAGRVLKAAAQPILARAKRLAPRGASGATQGALLMRKATSRKGRVRVIVQESAAQGMPLYVPFAMLGHRVGRRSLGSARRLVKGNEFLQRAFAAEAKAAQSTIEQGLRDEIEKAAKTV